MIRFGVPPPPVAVRLLHRVLARRRALAAGLVALAVWLAGSAVISAVTVPTQPVVVAATDMPAGHRPAPGDLTVRPWPRSLAPPGTYPRIDEVVGVLTGAMTAGEPVLHGRVAAAPGENGAAGSAAGDALRGRVRVVVGLADPAAARLAVPGSVVDVWLPASPGDLIADGAPTDDGGDSDGGAGPAAAGAVVLEILDGDGVDGPLDWPGDTAGDGTGLVLAVTPAQAGRLAAAAGSGVAIAAPLDALP